MRIRFGQKIIDKLRRKKININSGYNYENNKLIIINDNAEEIVNPPYKINGLEIFFEGTASVVKIHESNNFINSCIRCGNQNYIEIQKDANNFPYKCLNIAYPMAQGSKLLIGKNTTFIDVKFYLHDEPNTIVKIGDDCLFSFDIIIWPSDGHTIIDNNGNILNIGQNISIGNHVWVGMQCKILKGSTIPDNSIIGACSVYTKSSCPDIKSGGLFTRVPAKQIKNNINWDFRNPYQYRKSAIKENV